MKKILTIVLAAILVVCAFAACNNNPTQNPSQSSGRPLGSEATPPPANQSTPESTPIVPVEITFEPCDETVYVVKTDYGLKLRTSTSYANDTNVAYIVDPGTALKRTGTHDDWSRVEYNGKTYYCSPNYLATELPIPPESTGGEDKPVIEFTEVNETVYINTGVEGGNANIYAEPDRSTLITDMALPSEGTALTRTGIYYENENDPEKLGWSRIVYNDKVCYIRNSVVSTTKPADPAESN